MSYDEEKDWLSGARWSLNILVILLETHPKKDVIDNGVCSVCSRDTLAWRYG